MKGSHYPSDHQSHRMPNTFFLDARIQMMSKMISLLITVTHQWVHECQLLRAMANFVAPINMDQCGRNHFFFCARAILNLFQRPQLLSECLVSIAPILFESCTKLLARMLPISI